MPQPTTVLPKTCHISTYTERNPNTMGVIGKRATSSFQRRYFYLDPGSNFHPHALFYLIYFIPISKIALNKFGITAVDGIATDLTLYRGDQLYHYDSSTNSVRFTTTYFYRMNELCNLCMYIASVYRIVLAI